MKKKIRFIYFQFTELKVCERVNTCTLSLKEKSFFLWCEVNKGAKEGGGNP